MLKKILKAFTFIFLFLIILNYVEADMEIWDIDCNDHGQILLELHALDTNRTYVDDISIRAKSFNLITYEKEDFIVNGSWDLSYLRKDPPARSNEYGIFTSDEAQLNKKIDYMIEVNYNFTDNGKVYFENVSKEIFCPGLFFSCTLLNLSIENCSTKQNVFTTYLHVSGLNQSAEKILDIYDDIEYKVRAEKRYFDMHGEYSREGGLPKDYSMEHIKDDLYLIKKVFSDGNFIQSLAIKFKGVEECWIERDYPNISLRDYKQCKFIKVEPEKPVEEKMAEEVGVEKERIVKEAIIEEYVPKEKNLSEEIEEKPEEDKFLISTILGFFGLIFIVAIIIILFLRKRKKLIKDNWFKDVEERLEKEAK